MILTYLFFRYFDS